MKNYHKKHTLFTLFTGFCLLILTGNLFAQNMFRKINDFDGDGKADYVITRNENGKKVWYVWQSRDGYRVFQWGLDTDQNSTGDYDGDGRTDFSVMRLTVIDATTAAVVFYHYLSSTNALSAQTSYITGNFGNPFGPTISPFPQDYDGDGKTDIVLLFSSTFSGTIVVIESSTGRARGYSPSGAALLPRLGDLTGDGKSDFVAVNPANYNVTITDYATDGVNYLHFGASGDRYVPADFDGDGKGDLTVFRESEGNWWTIRSSDNTFSVRHWGSSGDIPVPGDYDGDGKTDLAIWRKSSPQSQYWVDGSRAGSYVFAFSLPSDTLVTY